MTMYKVGQQVAFRDRGEAKDLGLNGWYEIKDVRTEEHFGVDVTLVILEDDRGKHEVLADDETLVVFDGDPSMTRGQFVVNGRPVDDPLVAAHKREIEVERQKRLQRSANTALRVLGEDVQKMVDDRTPYTAVILAITDQGWDRAFAEKFFADFLVRRYIESPE